LRQRQFDQILKDLKEHSWASSKGTPEGLRTFLQTQGNLWIESEEKSATKLSTTLRPTTEKAARPNSLSAIYGLRAQPLHSDGADLRRPPEIIVLHSLSPSETATVVLPLRDHVSSPMRSGIFTVNGRDGKFLSPVLGAFVRFDPGCMTASDHLAQKVVDDITRARARAHSHLWNDSNIMLFIDNRRALHAREAVARRDSNRTLNRMAFFIGANE
jgi:alpha-ketoglutarate-dependent taurine dioxygenase